MNVNLILEALRETFPAETLESQAAPIGETFVALPAGCIHPVAQVLVERFDLRHLSTITGQDTGSVIELLYHFWDGAGLTLRTSLPREEPHIATLTDLIPGAVFYEREVSDMLGVTFDGHPDPRALLLPDDWEDDPPLRQQPTAPSPNSGRGERSEGGFPPRIGGDRGKAEKVQ